MSVRRLMGMAFAVLFMAIVAPFSERAQAQEPVGMVMEGDFSITYGETGSCMVCVPSSSDGTIRLVIANIFLRRAMMHFTPPPPPAIHRAGLGLPERGGRTAGRTRQP